MASCTFTCKKCDRDFEVLNFWWELQPEVTCPGCNTVFETEWDYLDYDSVAAWLTKTVSDGTDSPQVPGEGHPEAAPLRGPGDPG